VDDAKHPTLVGLEALALFARLLDQAIERVLALVDQRESSSGMAGFGADGAGALGGVGLRGLDPIDPFHDPDHRPARSSRNFRLAVIQTRRLRPANI
jgi:hypothetical protein